MLPLECDFKALSIKRWNVFPHLLNLDRPVTALTNRAWKKYCTGSQSKSQGNVHALLASGSPQLLCEQAWAWGTRAIPDNQPTESQPLDMWELPRWVSPQHSGQVIADSWASPDKIRWTWLESYKVKHKWKEEFNSPWYKKRKSSFFPFLIVLPLKMHNCKFSILWEVI